MSRHRGRRGGAEQIETKGSRGKRRSYLSDMLPFHFSFVVRDVGSLGPDAPTDAAAAAARLLWLLKYDGSVQSLFLMKVLVPSFLHLGSKSSSSLSLLVPSPNRHASLFKFRVFLLP